MKRLTLPPCFLLLCLTSFGQTTLVDTRVNDVALGVAPSWYDDTNGKLMIRLATANEPKVDNVCWYIVADELLAPMGGPTLPISTNWTAPFFEITLPIESTKSKGRQLRVLEIKLEGDDSTIKVLAMVYKSQKRDRLVKELASHHLHVERGLIPIDDLMNRYELPYQSVNVGRSLSMNGPGVYLLSDHPGLSAVNGAGVVKFASMRAGVPSLEINGSEAVYSYFENLQITGNAALEMQILGAINQLSQPTKATTNLPPIRHEEPLF